MKSARRGKAGASTQASAVKKQSRAFQETAKVTPKGFLGSLPPNVLLKTYQDLLDCIVSTFHHLVSPADGKSSLTAVIQEIKGHLYERDFESAFSRREYLEAYAIRWSASRALCYLRVFNDVFFTRLDSRNKAGEEMRLEEDATAESANISAPSPRDPANRMICFGGGAAELCALGGLCHLTTIDADPLNTFSSRGPSWSVQLVDVADWSSVITLLHSALTSPRNLSPYASAAVKAANVAMVPRSMLESEFVRVDLLDHEQISRTQLYSCFNQVDIITFMFALNELYTVSLNKTQRLLLDITNSVRRGTLLLVVDSPGSYSTVLINQREKRYPMSWLLDHTLINMAAQACEAENIPQNIVAEESNANGSGQITVAPRNRQPTAVWEKLESKESEWFRLPAGLRYPLELEDMRYQLHLYRRI